MGVDPLVDLVVVLVNLIQVDHKADMLELLDKVMPVVLIMDQLLAAEVVVPVVLVVVVALLVQDKEQHGFPVVMEHLDRTLEDTLQVVEVVIVRVRMLPRS